jgi:hypothetical protein
MGPSGGASRVSRGGPWGRPPWICRSANRHFVEPGSRYDDLGFRVARVTAEPGDEPRLPESAAPLKLRPIAPQTVEAGKPLSVTATVENPAAWQGKLRYSLGPQSPAGTTINAQTGELTWTPPPGQPARQYDVAISVAASDSLRDQTAFTITVTRPVLPGKENLQSQIVIDLGGGVKLELLLIPAGEFMMGSPDSDKNATPDEKPQHRVRITKPFYLGKYLVTYAPQPDKHRPAFAGATLRRLPQARSAYAGRRASVSIGT